MKTKSNITTLDQILDEMYGIKGQPKREQWEQQFESFRLGVLLEEARLKLGMTQEELAAKCGTNKSYISRIENNANILQQSGSFGSSSASLFEMIDIICFLNFFVTLSLSPF